MKINPIVYMSILLFFCHTSCIFAGDAMITVHYNEDIGPVNKNVLGTNFIGFDPSTGNKKREKNYYGHADFGAGIWDSKKNKSVSKVIELARNARFSIVRLPGRAQFYDWKGAVGPNRQHFLYGIDEILGTIREINAEAILTINVFSGSEEDAADLIEYLNFPGDKSNPNGGVDWAAQRAENGHPEPYNIKYVEIGNESYFRLTPEEYARRYSRFYKKLKSLDPQLKIGLVLRKKGDWNKRVLKIVQDQMDFCILHIYPVGLNKKKHNLNNIDSTMLFKNALAAPLQVDDMLKSTQDMIRKYAGRSVPIAVTEFNGGFFQQKPVPYRHTLGTALLNADLIKVFMQPENHILCANNWNFVNAYWGMIENGFDGDYEDLYNDYYERPTYYVFKMYADHFGDQLIAANVQSAKYEVERFLKVAPAKGEDAVPFLSVNASKSSDGNTVYLMIVNKYLEEDIEARIVLNGFEPNGTAYTYTLWGENIDDTNEKKPHDRVRIYDNNISFTGSNLAVKLRKHSLTAVEIGK